MAGEAYVLAARLEVLGGPEFGQKLDAAAGKVQQAVGKMESAGKAGDNIGKSFDAAEKKAGLFEKAVGKVADTALRLATYKILNEVGQWVKDVADEFIGLDQAITNAISIQNGRADAFEGKFKSISRTLAVDLGTSAKDVGEQFYFLASAGLSVEEQLEAVPVTSALAKAGLIDMGKAAESVSQVFAIFKNSDHPATFQEISDTLVQAANDSQGTIEQFTDSLTNKAGTAASLFGQTMEDTVAVLEAFAERGIQGKSAGEQYAIVLRDLAIRAQKNKVAFKEYGIEVFDANGQMKSILDIIPNLQRALGGLSDEQRTAALTALGFTLRSQNVISTLLASGDAAVQYREKLKGIQGVTQEIVDKQLTGLQGKLDLLKSYSIELGFKGIDKLIEFGDYLVKTFGPAMASLEPAARAFGEGMGLVLSVVGDAAFSAAKGIIEGIATGIEKAGKFASDHQGAMVAFGAVIAAIATAYAAAEVIGLIGGGISLIGSAASGASAAVAALKNVGPAIAGITQAASFGQGLSAVGPALSAIGTAALPLAGILGAVVAVPVALWALSAYKRNEELKVTVKDLEGAFATLKIPVDEAALAIQGYQDKVSGAVDATLTKTEELSVQAVANMASARLSAKGLADEFALLGDVTLSELGAAILTGTNLFNDFNVTSDDTARQLEHIRDAAPIGPVRDLAQAMLDAYNNGQLTTLQIGDLAEAFDVQSDAVDKLKEKQAKANEVILEGALKAGEITPQWLALFGAMNIGELTIDGLLKAGQRFKEEQSFEQILGTFNEINPALTNLDGRSRDAEGAVNELGQTAAEVKEDFDNLSASLNGLIDGPLARLKGDIGVEEAFFKARKAVEELGGVGAASFDIMSEAGRKLYSDTLIPIAEALKTDITNGAEGSAQKLAQGYVEGRARLMDFLLGLGLTMEAAEGLAAEVGFGAEAVGRMAQQAGLLPAEITTDVNVTDNGTTEATAAELDAAAAAEREASIKAAADLAMAQSDLAGLASEPRTATINTTAVTEPANTNINTAASNRATRIDLNLQAGTVPQDIDWIARQRQSGVTPVLDGWAAAKTNDDANWVARGRSQTDVPQLDGWAAQAVNAQLNAIAQVRTAYINVVTVVGNAAKALFGADGMVLDGRGVQTFAHGGMREDHRANIFPGGPVRIFAEPETGGEAYIPLSPAKRNRSLQIWEDVGRRLGVDMQRYANGGMAYSASRGMSSGGGGGGLHVHIGANALRVEVAASVGADPNHLAGLVTRQMRPALDEFAADLVTRIQRKKGRA